MNKDTIISLVTLSIIMFFACILLNSWSEDISFYLLNRNPTVTEITDKKLSPLKDPLQKDLPEFQKMFKKYSHGRTYFLDPKAEYHITGRILSKNMKLGTWGFSRKDFDYVSLIDVVLGWDEISDVKLYKKNIQSLKQERKPDGSRVYWFYIPYNSRWSVDYAMSHTSHNHIIPATINVMSVLYSIKKFDIVKMDGYLVDIYRDGNLVAMTSLSRYDTDGTSRARQSYNPGGSCEIFYVKSVQIGDKVYK